MKHLFSLFACTALFGLALLAPAPAQANTITITLDNPTLIGTPGQTLQFFGTLGNSSGAEQFLNGFNGTILAPQFLVDTLPFFMNAPLSLPAGDVTPSLHLFDVMIPNNAVAGIYGGSFSLIGGATFDAQDLIGDGTFQVKVDGNVVPEPEAKLVLALGMAALSALYLRRRRASC